MLRKAQVKQYEPCKTSEEERKRRIVEAVYMEWQCPPKESSRKFLRRGTVAGGTRNFASRAVKMDHTSENLQEHGSEGVPTVYTSTAQLFTKAQINTIKRHKNWNSPFLYCSNPLFHSFLYSFSGGFSYRNSGLNSCLNYGRLWQIFLNPPTSLLQGL